MADADAYLTSLQSDETRTQDLACEELADLFDATVFTAPDADRLMRALVATAAAAELHLIQEAALNALGSGVVGYPEAAAALDLQPVVAMLPRCEPGSLVMALFTFGNARQPALRPVIEGFRGHEHPDVHQYAVDALATLDKASG